MNDITAAIAQATWFIENDTLYPTTRDALQTLLDSHARLSRTAVQWRRVEDELPPRDADVLVYYARTKRVARGRHNGLGWTNGDEWLLGVTHWAPLPSGPEE